MVEQAAKVDLGEDFEELIHDWDGLLAIGYGPFHWKKSFCVLLEAQDM